ncbi:MAG: energy-coupling factor ABC transporter ATP-binding protein [Campylobacteraceae bacterium]|nr:energy-coupling factor ABC transporter ATP-binding protein [Campylobacteraceae bacterium]
MSNLYELNNIEQHYDGKKVLSIDNLTLGQNQIVGFFGPNGSGKSTLFSLLSFVSKPSLGRIEFQGIENKKMDLDAKQSIVMVPQNPYLLKRSVFDNVAYGLKLRKDTKNLTERVYEALALVGLDISFAKRKWSQLSGGEAQRVALAARLILKPKVLILDEPTAGVDTNSAQLIKEAVLMAKQKWNTTLFIASHDHNWLNHICDKKIALFQGEIVESGSVNLLFAPWEKDMNGNLVKVFLDGQRLFIENSQDKKRDSVVMVSSDAITLTSMELANSLNCHALRGIVRSIHQQQEDFLLIETSVGGVCLNSKISRMEMQKQKLLPGDKVCISIDTTNVCYI